MLVYGKTRKLFIAVMVIKENTGVLTAVVDDSNEKEELYRILVENAMDALILCDEKLNLIYTSPSTERLFGYKENELKGHNAFEFFHPEDLSAHEERVRLLLAGKEFSSIEFRIRKNSGDYVWCDVATKAMQTANGETRIVVVTRGINERKEMQEKLEKLGALCDMELNKTKEYLEQLISRLPLAIIAWDNDCKIKTWNPKATEMFRFSESEFLKRNPEDLFSLKKSSCPIKQVWDQLLKDGQAIFTGENVTNDGRIIICTWTNILLRNENGNPDGVLSMIQDVTEQKKLEERLTEIAYSLSGVKAGESYLIGSIQESLKIAFDLTNHRVKGLFIVREDPDYLIKNYNFKHEDIVLLSARSIKDFEAINSLQDIAITITKFLKNGGGVVVLGGLEYLISRCGFNPVFMMIQEKRFEVLEAGATLLVPINLATLDTKEKGLLTSELKLIN